MRFTTTQRRSRLVCRHHLGMDGADIVAAADAVVGLHSSDPLTPHLAGWARVPGHRAEDLETALVAERSLVRMHAMRRTLWVLPATVAPVFEAGAARAIAARERRRIEKWLSAEMPADAAAGWLARLGEEVVAAVGDGELTTAEVRAAVPGTATPITVGSGSWKQRTAVLSRLLFQLAMEGRLRRSRAAGSWRSSQYAWVAGPGPAAEIDPAAARSRILERYLERFGPATTTDVRWWSGWTARQCRVALTELAAAEVDLGEAGTGWILPDDRGDLEPAPPVAALLPGLDPTPMGWKERGWFLGGHQGPLFDRNGNVGPTAWWEGRVVGGWAAHPRDGVKLRLLEDIGAEGEAALRGRATQLETWLDGEVPIPRFRTPLERELSA